MKLRLPHQLLSALLVAVAMPALQATELSDAALRIDDFSTMSIASLIEDGWTLTNLTGTASGSFTTDSTASSIAVGSSGTAMTTASGNSRHVWSGIVTIDAATLKSAILLRGGNANGVGLGVSKSDTETAVTGTWGDSNPYVGNNEATKIAFNIDDVTNADGTVTLGVVFNGESGTTIYVGDQKFLKSGLTWQTDTTKATLANQAGVTYGSLYWFSNALSDADMQAAMASASAGVNTLTWAGTADNHTWSTTAATWQSGEESVAFSTKTGTQRNEVVFGAADNKNVEISGSVETAAAMKVTEAGYTFTVKEGASLRIEDLQQAADSAPAFAIEAGGKIITTANGDSAYVLQNATGAGDLTIEAPLTVLAGSTNSAAPVNTQLTGTLTVGNGSSLSELKIGRTATNNEFQNRYVSIKSFSNVVLDKGKLWYHANTYDEAAINNLTVTANGGELYIQDTQSTDAPAFKLGGTTTLNGQLTLGAYWKSTLNIESLTGSGTLNIVRSDNNGEGRTINLTSASGVALTVNDSKATVNLNGTPANSSLGAISVTKGTLNIKANASATTLAAEGTNSSSLNIDANKTLTLTTATGNKNYSGVKGSGTLAVNLNAGASEAYSKLTLGDAFTGKLAVTGNLSSISELGGTTEVTFNNNSALVYAHTTTNANGYTGTDGIDDFSTNIRLASGATMKVLTWGNNSNTHDNRISGNITLSGNGTINKGDTGKLTISGSTISTGSNRNLSFNANSGTLIFDDITLSGRLDINGSQAVTMTGGLTATAAGSYGYSLVVNNVVTLQGSDDAAAPATYDFGTYNVGINTGKTLKVGANATMSSGALYYTPDNDYGSVEVAEGASVTVSGQTRLSSFTNAGSVSFGGKTQIATLTNTGSLSITNDNAALVKTLGNFSQTASTAKTTVGADTTVSASAAAATAMTGLVEVKDGGVFNITDLTNVDAVSFSELTLGSNAVMGAYTGSSIADAEAEATITVTDLLSAGEGATLNANLVLENGSMLDIALSGLNMGSTLTLGTGSEKIDLNDTWKTQLDALTLGDRLNLFTGVDDLYLGNTAYTEEVLAKDYFNLGTLVDPDTIVLSYDGSNVSLAVIPEPATATLSLLALAGLAARRRRH